MTTRRTLLLGLAGVGLLLATVLQALHASAPPLRLRKADPGDRRLAAEGRVVAYPDAEVTVAAERAGRLLHVKVKENQSVRRGELLAEIDSDELRAELQQARAKVDEAEAEVRLAGQDLERREQLVAERIAAAHELDQAVRDLETSRARLATARAAVAFHAAQLRKTRILAPIDGTVIARAVDAGERVEAGTPVVTLADLARLRVEGEADEADAPDLVVGAEVALWAQGHPERQWRGRIEELADSVTLRRLKPQDPSRPTDTRILTVKVAFAEPNPLRLGTTVELRLAPRR